MELRDNERVDDLGIKNYKIIQNTKNFCFGIDSVILANMVKGLNDKSVVVDLCTGSVVIPTIICGKNRVSRIFGVELQEEMVDLAKRNVKLNKLENKIQVVHEDINNVKDIKKIINEEGYPDTVDVITVNPPYKKVGTGVQNENQTKNIARHEIKCTLEDIFTVSKKLLKDKGKMYMVHKPERLTDILYYAREYKLEPKKIRFMQPKIGVKPSLVFIEFVKGGNNEVNIVENLIEYNEDGTYTDEINKIYGIKE